MDLGEFVDARDVNCFRGINTSARLRSNTNVKITQTACETLCALANDAYIAAPNDDLKLAFDPTTVLDATTREALSNMVHGATAWIVRRSIGNGTWIPFHQDAAQETVQVVLHDADAITGGKLVFARPYKFVYAAQETGVPVYYDSAATYAVTPFTHGLRFVLYVFGASNK